MSSERMSVDMDTFFMSKAIALAKEAYQSGEVPVGAVIVKNGEIIGMGFNRRETEKNSLMHAEISAIDEACKTLGDWRLSGCTMYVTLEPCPMCAGAIINARIDRVVFGAADKKAGCLGSVIDLFSLPFNHKPDVFFGVLEDECKKILEDFFLKLR